MTKWLCACGCGTRVRRTYVHGHNRKGKKASPIHSKRLSAARRRLWADPEYKERTATSIRTSWQDPEVIQRHKEGRDNSPAFQRHMKVFPQALLMKYGKAGLSRIRSAALLRSYAEGRSTPLGRGRWTESGYFRGRSGVRRFYQSSWELALLRILDATPGIRNQAQYKELRISFRWNGKQHTYFPDGMFSLKGVTFVYEIKPRELVRLTRKSDNGRFDAKTREARRYCRRRGWLFVLITRYPTSVSVCFPSAEKIQ